MVSVGQQPVFRGFGGNEDDEPEVTEIESLCMNCHANGVTRLLLTRIPHYKNVVVMSFSCEHCGYENNEIQPGGAYADKGVLWKLRVETPEDLNRQVVKSDYTCVRIPSLEFEIPANSQNGEVTTVEGILSRAISGLSQDQEARRVAFPAEAAQLDDFLQRLAALRDLRDSWTLELEDITGNCFVENPVAPRRDPRCERRDFSRSRAQDLQLGIYNQNDETPDDSSPSENDNSDSYPNIGSLRLQGVDSAPSPAPSAPTPSEGLLSPAGADAMPYERLEADEVLQFRTNCPDCNAPCDTNMKMTNIPHFKEVVIMSTTCDYCGHRTNEVKSGGGIEDRGVRFEVRVAGKDDFSRDILKSETCSMEVPELELEVGGRALGGRFTTAEGILSATAAQLRACPGAGDAPSLSTDKLDKFIEKLEEVLRGERAVTIILDDPAGNSYVQSLADDPTQPDPGLKITRYERNFEQNEELGLNDINTDDYLPSR
ncbi:hypothetical protein B5X24_HaOG213937 [Helicoverpa armigera]|uniref:Zinc finger ZPR1-type domain-containing protein n=1 Tax=Helicoverpa armigera TaxID=29058 RepID=A0A2W1BA45_HELAM|nr:hypothetical protein B5X24_HaOG213937 [Helicoverpa armigera]